ncbi:hypothetical protein PUN28_017692 [Cardiocondyla obscurior]|uniref:Uncharacterized protein n=1 Tax=Cardiocondyla obscurior TaxID=286306 RepID=A0AAW2EIN0_9HYME
MFRDKVKNNFAFVSPSTRTYPKKSPGPFLIALYESGSGFINSNDRRVTLIPKPRRLQRRRNCAQNSGRINYNAHRKRWRREREKKRERKKERENVVHIKSHQHYYPLPPSLTRMLVPLASQRYAFLKSIHVCPRLFAK